MNVDCHWITANLESFFCDRLSADEHRLARLHIETCTECRNEVEDLEAVDLQVKRYFQHQLSLAKTHRPRRSRLSLGAVGAAGAVMAALIALAVLLQRPAVEKTGQPETLPAVVSSSSTPIETVAKDSSVPETIRAKPDVVDAAPAIIAKGSDVELKGDVDFVVIDPAGYIRTLEDYRGYAVLIGIWSSSEPQSGANLERIYQTFGGNAGIRVLGASNEQQGKPPNTTFPVVYNHGSTLWEATSGEFVLLDQTGQFKLRGSLLNDFDRLSQTLRTTLQTGR